MRFSFLPSSSPSNGTDPRFIAFDYESRYPEARAYLAELVKQGKLRYNYYVVPGGLDGCVPALTDMFGGKNFGKTVVSFKEDGRGAKL